MYEIGGDEIQTMSMDHLGLMAAVCKDLGIAEKLDKKLGPRDERRVISPGIAAVAMILNGLGFTDRRLYLAHQFFENRPIEKMLCEGITAKDITDYTLGHALDEISEYGASKLFGEIAFDIAISNNLLGMLNHIDTTTFSMHGKYDVDDATEVLEITYGHSKARRILSLVVNGPASMPIWMEPLDGNTSDKSSFHQTIKNMNDFKKQINVKTCSKWVADSALYSKEKLLSTNDYLWLCRVPETVKEAKKLVEISNDLIEWETHDKGYKSAEYKSNYGDREQRWILVYSEQAYLREKKTLDKRFEKEAKALEKELWHLSNAECNCEIDAASAIKKVEKKYKYFTIDGVIMPAMKYENRGRPLPGEEKIISGYKFTGSFRRNEDLIAEYLNSKGRFILATNDLAREDYSSLDILKEYEQQQNVECGFRFLKDPWFMVDSIFLKSPKRIEALMMIMTLCLMVYNIAQYKLRKSLQESNETIPNQLNKQVQNPTMRWIFQLMEGVSVVCFHEEEASDGVGRKVITNLNALRKKIIRLFGQTACEIYGLNVENSVEVLGI